MPNILITRRFPAAPSKDAVLFGLPVASGTLTPLADGINGLVGWRALRSASWTVDHAPAQSPVRPYINTAPDAGPFTTRVWMDVGDIATTVRVALVYQAAARPSVTPSIKVELHRGFDGLTFRDAIIFDDDAGTLDNGVTNQGNRWPLFTVMAPVEVGASAAGAGTPTRPRLLNLGADARQTMELRIVATHARVLFAYAVEGYQEVVPQ